MEKRIKLPKIYLLDGVDAVQEFLKNISGVGVLTALDLDLGVSAKLIKKSSREAVLPISYKGNLRGECYVLEDVMKIGKLAVISKFNDYSGALESVNRNILSDEGKVWVQSAGVTKDKDVDFVVNNDRIQESKAEVVKGVIEHFSRAKTYFINLLNGKFYFCSDPVALDKFCYDNITNLLDKNSFLHQDNEKDFLTLLNFAEKIGVGSIDYEIAF